MLVALFIASLLAVLASGIRGDADGIVIRMPGVKPQRKDTYLCTSLRLPDRATNGNLCLCLVQGCEV